jgi:hypothetical protein
MDPSQQGHNPYDFIVNPQQPSKRRLFKFGGDQSSLLMRIAIAAGGGVVLLFLIFMVWGMLFGSKVNIAGIAELTQIQTELVRLSHEADSSGDQAVRNAAANTLAIAESHRQLWLTFLLDNGRKMADKELRLKASAATDTRLKTAAQTGTFDTEYAEVMRSQLTAYANDIRAAHDKASSDAERNSLAEQFEDIKLLLKQWPEGTGGA